MPTDIGRWLVERVLRRDYERPAPLPSSPSFSFLSLPSPLPSLFFLSILRQSSNSNPTICCGGEGRVSSLVLLILVSSPLTNSHPPFIPVFHTPVPLFFTFPFSLSPFSTKQMKIKLDSCSNDSQLCEKKPPITSAC